MSQLSAPARRALDWVWRRPWPRTDPLTVVCLLALMLLSFLQRPGKVTFDTKLDLVVDPIGFMARSLHLWNPEATSGELQNQAYGYLFPMGPFFAAGQALGVPMWLTQRVWSGLLLCLAFGGALLLARALGIGSRPARYVGALAYALAPRMLTEVGTLSAEMLPAALLPWVVLPLVRVDRIGSPRRAAGLSALGVLFMGGINGAMVIMSLVLPGLYLLTRRFTRAHLALIGWWVGGVTAAVLWWFLPLLLLGQYSLPFLAYIESAANTTGVVSLLQAVRGTNQWVAYVVQGEPWWPAGWMLIDSPVLIAATVAVGALGLLGLALRGLPERHFLVLAVLAGLALLTVGYVGALDSPLSGRARDLLDGPLAPLRNVHKFEPVLRLPLALGLMHAVSVAVPAVRWRRLSVAAWLGRWGWAGPAIALVAVAAAPAWLFALRPGPGWDDMPSHWRQAAAWLAEQDPHARTLVVPGSGFGHYTWGRTVDEPISPLAGAPWALRNQVPLGSEGNTRVMDTVEEVLATGRGSPGLADYLARNGYRFVLLRNDLDRERTQAPPAAVLRQALAGSTGLRVAASFGDPVRAPLAGRSPVDVGERQPPAIEVYDVGRPVPPARAALTADVATVSGGPESMLPLLEQGLLGAGQPAVLAGDIARDPAVGAAAGTASLVTDGLRLRERNVGLVRDNVSHTLSVDEPARLDRAARDLVPVGDDLTHYTIAVHQGVRSVTAASATSYADAPSPALDPSHLPFAAVDGDPGTAWHSATVGGPRGQWLEVNLGTPRQITEVGVEFVDDIRVGWPIARFRLTTDNGSVDHDVAPVPGARRYALPPGGLVTTIRVTVLSVRDGRATGNVGIRELTLPDTRANRALRVPTDATGRAGFAFTRGHHARVACYPTGPVVRCDPRLARRGEEPLGLDRLFATRSGARYDVSATVVPRPGGLVPVTTAPLTATATSWLAGDPHVAPHAAVDGDPATAWLADVGDRDPRLTVRWDQPRRIDRVRLRFPLRPVASRVTAVELTAGDRTHTVPLSLDGSGRFPEVETDRLVVRIVGVDGHPLDRRGNIAEATAGFAEVELPGLVPARGAVSPETGFTIPCGSGPAVTVDGVGLPTSVTGTLGDYLVGRALPLRVCDPFDPAADAEAIDVVAGEHRLRTEPSAHFVVQDAALRPAGPAGAGPAGPPATRTRDVTVRQWDPTVRTLAVGPGERAVLVVPENANAGWRAALDGADLPALRVDGWQQAWLLPAGDGGQVALEFTPDRSYRLRLAVGALAALLVVALAALPPRGRRASRKTPAARLGSAARLAPGPANGYPIAVGIALLVAALAGPLGVVLLLAGALVRQLRPRLLAWVVVGGAATAATVALGGRLTGHGQAWAYEPVTQAAMLLALCAGAAAAAVPVPGGIDLEDGVGTPGPRLHDQAGEDGEPGGGRGGRGDLPDRAVQPPGDQSHLDADGEPHQGDRAQVTAGDPGHQQDLRDGEQATGEREHPERDGLPAVPQPADQG